MAGDKIFGFVSGRPGNLGEFFDDFRLTPLLTQEVSMFRKLFGLDRKGRSSQPRPSAPKVSRSNRWRPQLEALEDRCLPSMVTVTNLLDDGAGSLRAAIRGAASGDTVNFAVSGMITLTTGPLVINKDLTIAGPGAYGATALTVSGNHTSRVFDVTGSSTVNISDL